MSHQNVANIFDAYAKEYAAKFELLPHQEEFIKFISDTLPEGSEILDLGCGPGNILHYFSKANKDFKLSAWDLASNMLKLAKSRVPEANCHKKNILDIETSTSIYDSIVASFCVPYLNPEEVQILIKGISSSLKTNGYFLFAGISSPFYQEVKLGASHQEIHMHIHPEDFVQNCMTSNGMKILQEKRVPVEKPPGEWDYIFLGQKIV